MKTPTRFWLLLIAALVVVTLIIGGSGDEGPPLDPRSVSPDGARAVVEVLERLGADVDLDDPVPSADATAALLLIDRLADDDRRAVTAWVRAGGVLVVADSTSELAASGTGFAATEVLPGNCTLTPFESLDDATVITGLGRTFRAGSLGGCFGTADRFYISADRLGQGAIVSVGGTRLFTNDFLGRGANAFVAVSLLAPEPDGAKVAVLGASTFEFGEGPASGRIAPRVMNAIIMLLASFLIFALHRMRRLGAVVDEPMPVQIRGSELVLQAGALSERAADPASAGEVIRADFLDRWRRAMGSPDADIELVVAELSQRAEGDHDELDRALRAAIGSDEDLVGAVAVFDRIDQAAQNPSPQKKKDLP